MSGDLEESEYDLVMGLLTYEHGMSEELATDLLDKITTAAVVEELKRLLLTAKKSDDTLVTIFNRIVELEETLR